MKKIIIVLAIALFSINTNAQDKACCTHKETMSTEEVAKCKAKCKAEGKKCDAKVTEKKGKSCCAKKA